MWNPIRDYAGSFHHRFSRMTGTCLIVTRAGKGVPVVPWEDGSRMSQPSSASDVGHLASTRRGRTRAVPEVRSMTVNAEIQIFHYLLFLELLWARILNVVLMNSIYHQGRPQEMSAKARNQTCRRAMQSLVEDSEIIDSPHSSDTPLFFSH